jgi:hypothetical protein
MNCNESNKIFNDYFDGLLNNEQVLDMEIHIRECSKCKHEFAVYSNLFESIKLLPVNMVPPKKLALEIFNELSKEVQAEQSKSTGVINKLKSKIMKK